MARPAEHSPEVEITPEMIEAGLSAYYAYDSRFDPEEELPRRIFVAMLRARVARAMAIARS